MWWRIWSSSSKQAVSFDVGVSLMSVAKVEMAKPENYLAMMGYGGLVFTGIISIGYIRRRWWMLFKFGHHVGITVLVAGVSLFYVYPLTLANAQLNYHSPNVIPYLLAVYALVLMNGVIRFASTRFVPATFVALHDADSTVVTLPSLSRGFTAGQHIRIRLWSLHGFGWRDALEAHPFTIASAPGEPVRLIIKRAGDWTDSLHQLVTASGGDVVSRCSVEGPYGGPINFIFPAFESVLLVAGGSGISFALGVARGLLHDVRHGRAACKHIALVWVVREHANLAALWAQIEDLVQLSHGLGTSATELRFEVTLCHTRSATVDVPESKKTAVPTNLETHTSCVKVVEGRPDLDAVLSGVVERTNGGGVGLGVCGPRQLGQDLTTLVNRVAPDARKRAGGVELHVETFSL